MTLTAHRYGRGWSVSLMCMSPQGGRGVFPVFSRNSAGRWFLRPRLALRAAWAWSRRGEFGV